MLLISYIADLIRERQVGSVVTYVVNLNINFTNICTKGCLFCAYSVPPKSKEGFFNISKDFIKQKIQKTSPYKITEVCVQGGINPQLRYENYLQILKSIREIDPSIHIHAFSPQEVQNAVVTSEKTIEEVLVEFKKQGLDSMPGTAAEILDNKIRRKICPKKINTEKWVEIITLAHEKKIPTTATIMFGHIESMEHWVKHLSIIKNIQEETHGFTEFIPLPFIGEKTPLVNEAKFNIAKMTEMDYLKFYSLARLYLGNEIPNIQTSWVKLGFPMAQLTLNAGCNDIGGTLFEENITRSAGGSFGQVVTPPKIQEYIKEINRPFAERDTLYNIFH
ncbi:MAG: 5-amino-6-(D-ribitylamino)uracil--L-tyrosine 4-hydroxyphenyl transferase CofH [Candidatus Hodarchaeales archaeon]